MAIDRWDPFRDTWSLRDAMDRLFQENFVRPTSALLSGGRTFMPIDVMENDSSYVVRATLPGIQPDDVQITITGDTLTIRGESRTEDEQKGQNWIVRERRGSSFYRSITLPSPVNSDQAQAQYENGVLALTLPKAAESRPKQIRIGNTAGAISTTATGTPVAAEDQSRRVDIQSVGGQPSGSQTGQAGVPTDTQASGQQRQNIVDQASEQSFPTSDPPSYSPEAL